MRRIAFCFAILLLAACSRGVAAGYTSGAMCGRGGDAGAGARSRRTLARDVDDDVHETLDQKHPVPVDLEFEMRAVGEDESAGSVGRMVTRRGALFGLVALLAACSRAEPALEVPSADEYAVWAAAVDARFGEQRLRVAMEEQTDRMLTTTPAFVASHRADPELSPGLLDDYVARNLRPARVDARRVRTREVTLLPQFGGLAGSAVRLSGDGRLVVSRVGFDPGGNWALVTVAYWCDGWCGEGAMLVMERGSDGRWRHTATVMESYA
jgi:hypothetical protein